jgi:hypothetical protein
VRERESKASSLGRLNPLSPNPEFEMRPENGLVVSSLRAQTAYQTSQLWYPGAFNIICRYAFYWSREKRTYFVLAVLLCCALLEHDVFGLLCLCVLLIPSFTVTKSPFANNVHRLFCILNLVQKYAPMFPFHANVHLKILLSQYVSRIFSLTGFLSVLKNVDSLADACAIACWSKCIDIPFIDHSCGWYLRYLLLTARLFFIYYYQGCVIVWSDPMVLNSHDLLCTHNLES